MEITRLKQEQRALEEELQGMTKRLETTERRPQQMMAFLYKVVEDPDILPRMMLQSKHHLTEKKRRLAINSSATSSNSSAAASSIGAGPGTSTNNSVKTEEEDDVVASTEAGFELESFYYQSPTSSSQEDHPAPAPAPGWWGQRPAQAISHEGFYNGFTSAISPNPISPVSAGRVGDGVVAMTPSSVPAFSSYVSGYGSGSSNGGSGQIGYFTEVVAGMESSSPDPAPPPYPFSLFGGGF